MRCAHCGGTNLQAGFNTSQCLDCGLQTHANGEPIAPAPSQHREGE